MIKNRLKETCDARGWALVDLRKAVDSFCDGAQRDRVAYSTLHALYRDKTDRIAKSTLEAVCGALGCQTDNVWQFVPGKRK